MSRQAIVDLTGSIVPPSPDSTEDIVPGVLVYYKGVLSTVLAIIDGVYYLLGGLKATLAELSPAFVPCPA